MFKSMQLKPFPSTLNLELTKKDLPDGALGLTSLAENGSIMIQIDTKPSLPDLTYVAVHEAVHVVQFLQQYVETEFDQETEAYLVESTARWICQQLAKVKRK